MVQISSDILKVLTKTFHMWHRTIYIFWAIKNADFLETPNDEVAMRFNGYQAKAVITYFPTLEMYTFLKII